MTTIHAVIIYSTVVPKESPVLVLGDSQVITSPCTRTTSLVREPLYFLDNDSDKCKILADSDWKKHRRNLRGIQGVPVPSTFCTEGYYTPTFQDEKVENHSDVSPRP